MPNTSRFSSGANQDNTLRTKTQDYQAPAYAATISPKINADFTNINVAQLTGALTFNPDVANAYIGDEVNVLFSADGTARTVTLGANIAPTAATIVVAINKFASLTLRFNGTIWVEVGRSVTV